MNGPCKMLDTCPDPPPALSSLSGFAKSVLTCPVRAKQTHECLMGRRWPLSTSGDNEQLLALACCPPRSQVVPRPVTLGTAHTLSQQLPGSVTGSARPEHLLGVTQMRGAQRQLSATLQPPSLRTTCTSSCAGVLLCQTCFCSAKHAKHEGCLPSCLLP